jgi:hypothetical protein
MHITRHLTITGCAVVVAALGAGGATAVAQTATHTPSKLTTSAPQARADCDIISPTSGDHAWLDGFSIGSLPAGLGPQVSDFEYEWEDVRFTSRVWETGPDDDGAYRVDLHIAVLRGEVLTDAEAMHAFLAEYHERDPAVWARDQFRHADGSWRWVESVGTYLLDDPAVDIASLAAEIVEESERNDPNVVKVVGTPVGERRLRALYFTRATAPTATTRAVRPAADDRRPLLDRLGPGGQPVHRHGPGRGQGPGPGVAGGHPATPGGAEPGGAGDLRAVARGAAEHRPGQSDRRQRPTHRVAAMSTMRS